MRKTYTEYTIDETHKEMEKWLDLQELIDKAEQLDCTYTLSTIEEHSCTLKRKAGNKIVGCRYIGDTVKDALIKALRCMESVRVDAKKIVLPESICLGCRNATASKCKWLAISDLIGIEYIMNTDFVTMYHGGSRPSELYCITKCASHKKGKLPPIGEVLD